MAGTQWCGILMKNDLTGQTFGLLSVVKRSRKKDKNRRVYWLCRCECGNTTEVDTTRLTTGVTKSCGCLKRRPKAQDLTSKVFGQLTVMKRVGTNKNRKPLWQCRCKCGKETVVCTSDLKSGNTKSCGCMHYHFAKNHPYDISRF